MLNDRVPIIRTHFELYLVVVGQICGVSSAPIIKKVEILLEGNVHQCFNLKLSISVLLYVVMVAHTNQPQPSQFSLSSSLQPSFISQPMNNTQHFPSRMNALQVQTAKHNIQATIPLLQFWNSNLHSLTIQWKHIDVIVQITAHQLSCTVSHSSLVCFFTLRH